MELSDGLILQQVKFGLLRPSVMMGQFILGVQIIIFMLLKQMGHSNGLTLPEMEFTLLLQLAEMEQFILGVSVSSNAL